jgi:hypothetical protein
MARAGSVCTVSVNSCIDASGVLNNRRISTATVGSDGSRLPRWSRGCMDLLLAAKGTGTCPSRMRIPPTAGNRAKPANSSIGAGSSSLAAAIANSQTAHLPGSRCCRMRRYGLGALTHLLDFPHQIDADRQSCVTRDNFRRSQSVGVRGKSLTQSATGE